MTQVNIPESRKWTQPNTTVLFGNIYETKNIDFSLPGFLKIAPRTRYVGREDASTASYENLLSIAYAAAGGTASGFSSTYLYYLLTNDTIYVATPSLGNFGALTNATPPTVTIYSDLISPRPSNIFVTSNQDVNLLSGGTWVNGLINSGGGTILDASTPHPLCYGFDGLIYIGNGNDVTSIEISGNNPVGNVVVLPAIQQIQWIRSFNAAIWIGTRNLGNGNAKVYQWDAVADNFNQEFDVDAQWVYSACDWQGNFYIMTNDGRLMSFNGAGFTEVARLPVYTDIISQNNYVYGNAFSLGSIFQRGMSVIDGKIHVLISAEATTDAGDTYEATSKLPAGIWVYDPEVGFYHKYAPSNSTSTTNTDFGQMALEDGAGAISKVFSDPTSASAITSSVGGTLIYGAKLNGATTTNYFTFGSVTSGENRGYFTTGRIESPEMQESWRHVWLKFEELENSTDAIVLKYKTKNRENLPFTTTSDVTWTSTTVFTSTDTKFTNVVAGDEVTVLTGGGAGSTAHVSTISYANPTYTVTLDEAITGVVNTNVAKVAVDNYHKLTPSITEAAIATEEPNVNARYAKIPIPLSVDTTYQPAPSEWLQVKVEMRGENVRISAMSILSETQVKIII
jgi:hypothetical protein